jgi:hypothetical protein
MLASGLSLGRDLPLDLILSRRMEGRRDALTKPLTLNQTIDKRRPSLAEF